VEFHASIGSTNDRAWELLRAGSDGVAVVADLQTAGRGRHGRTWSSPAGLNLMVSVGIQPRLLVTDAWQLAFGAALAVRAACESALAQRSAAGIALKWPNDVVGNDGRKLAGILIETAVSGDLIAEAVVGAGINVNWASAEMPHEIAGTSTSLSDMAEAVVDRVALLGAYLATLDTEVAGIEGGSSPLERFRNASWLTGREVRVSVADGEAAGTVAGIGDHGSLLLQTDAGLEQLGWGEVVQVRPSGAEPAMSRVAR
jgi:BirA family biotin operon repressor/biotin-[acetyl-CoA-carboxylase] ligase